MCGIVGLFSKSTAVEERLGQDLGAMLGQMSDRGPDSAGVAVYRDPAPTGASKVSLHSADPAVDWERVRDELAGAFGGDAEPEIRASHAVFVVDADADTAQAWLRDHHPELRIMSAGERIEIFKEMGLPTEFVRRFALDDIQGSHALGHTRMATESRVTTQHSHPFSTGLDLCLVHNGSLSNHNRLRMELRR
jgi:glutamate synthase domain-containing protein 1